MTKQARNTGKQARRNSKQQRAPRNELPGDSLQVPRAPFKRKAWAPLTDAQASLANAVNVYPITFVEGEFGTGKTFVPTATAADRLIEDNEHRFVLTRPAVGAGEELGFFPGELEDKVLPWAQPVIDILNERLGTSFVEYLLKTGRIEIAPLGMLRGRTFSNCTVLLDEAQNTTPKQMKMFLSRIGEGTSMIVDGDLKQTDITGPSGLADAVKRFKSHPQFGYVRFGIDDIVRSGIAKEVCLGYADEPRERDAPVTNPVPDFFNYSAQPLGNA
ncbi:phosphate starvation-inducible protein PhoH [Sphingomonas sp. NFR04]|uniref:PhoH family protein n=1 Tax=Sphingomonas sp. NFR04 TaxID=1566283 RepID=UPI0008E84FF6|nr:PhoH family protein [Sphingomonas sp. NFR04]SFJ50185.1 phosphate starvation-inducible protein PhoH [Sphingomonas sp. NFR04]